MFSKLKGRKVLINYEGGDTITGSVQRISLLAVELVDVAVLEPGRSNALPVAGSARLRRRLVRSLQVLS